MSRYIDADALYKALEKIYCYEMDLVEMRDSSILITFRTVCRKIDSIPTADVVEVVHSEWIEDWEIGCSDCSHCGKGYLWEDYKGVADWKYCPNCGAKIDNRSEIERGHNEQIY